MKNRNADRTTSPHPEQENLVKQAVKNFHGPQKYNCAQAILVAFKEIYGIGPRQIEDAAGHGGGRAEGGCCGALYAARQLLNDPLRANTLEKRFAERAGSTTCREIRKLKRLSCAGCVEAAAVILQGLDAPKIKK